MFRALGARPFSFALRFLLTFLLLLAVWRFISPFYARAMAVTGQGLLRTVSLLPPGSRLEARENRVWVFRPVTRADGTSAMAGINVLDEAIYFNLVILLSLIVATPSLRWSAMAGASAIGLAVLALLHLSDLYVKLKWTAIFPGLRLSGVIPDVASPLTLKVFEWLYAFFSLFGFGLFPVVIWIGVVSLWWDRGRTKANLNLEEQGRGIGNP